MTLYILVFCLGVVIGLIIGTCTLLNETKLNKSPVDIQFYCRTCWDQSYFEFDRELLHGKTVREIRSMVEYRHKCAKPDVRLYNLGRIPT